MRETTFQAEVIILAEYCRLTSTYIIGICDLALLYMEVITLQIYVQ